jgi:hypothetical protein
MAVDQDSWLLEELRRGVRERLPEIAEIQHEDLREKVSRCTLRPHRDPVQTHRGHESCRVTPAS